MLCTEGLSFLLDSQPVLLGSSFIATSHWFIPSFTTGVLWVRRKESSHLLSFYFLGAFIHSIITLAECLPVFVISGLSWSFLEMESSLLIYGTCPEMQREWQIPRSWKELNPIPCDACAAPQWYLSNKLDVCSRQNLSFLSPRTWGPAKTLSDSLSKRHYHFC